MDIWRNLASTIPENHPAARSGCNVVTGATKNAVMAEYIFEPESSDPANARPPVSNMNVVMLVWIFIPLISANAKIITKIAGIENSMSLPTGIFDFFFGYEFINWWNFFWMFHVFCDTLFMSCSNNNNYIFSFYIL
jgi:hypothetical protein